MKQLNLQMIEKFAEKNGTRTWLQSAFKFDNGACASNGHVLIVAADVQVEPLEDWNAKHIDGVKHMIDTVTRKAPPGEYRRAKALKRADAIEHNKPISTRSMKLNKFWTVQHGAAHISLPYHNLIAGLPKAEIADSTDETMALWFRCTGAYGLVMPVRI